jgi:hypothetical protein
MQIVHSLDEEFRRLHARALRLVRAAPAAKLYWQPADVRGRAVRSCGEHLLRAAACVEQTFGGITANLWDDPFEWTLPETLTTPEQVAAYLAEVEATRQRGFALVRSDADLLKEIALPSGAMQPLGALLLDTLVRAAEQQGRAYVTFSLFADSGTGTKEE